MTAEIAILNKLAVALAADSAVAIGRPPNLKIYNTVNKIFELSSHNPVAVMVYGRLDFMGVPYEPLIKEYRKKVLGKTKFDHISEYAEHFRRHLANDVAYSDDDARTNVAALLTEDFSAANNAIDDLIRQSMRQSGKFLKSKVNGIAQAYLKERIAALKPLSFAPGFTSRKVPTQYDGVVDRMIDRQFASNLPTATTKRLVKDYAGYLISKSRLSAYRTGIVVAGFGDKEMFPSLARVEVDGVVDGKLRYREFPVIDIDRAGPQADILGFAQEDMIKSFLDGIDPSVRKFIENVVSTSIEQTFDAVSNAIITDPKKAAAFKGAIQGQVDKIVSGVKSSIDDHVEEYSANPIRDMVKSMPKQELATLASSLIEITSLKRKVSRDQETVGGDVDVAIVSKSEGFVWIKRKHYFPAEPNRRFFSRQVEEEKP